MSIDSYIHVKYIFVKTIFMSVPSIKIINLLKIYFFRNHDLKSP